MATIGGFPTGSCILVGSLGVKMGILIVAFSSTHEALVLLLLVPTCSCVIVVLIDKLPTGSFVSMGNMEISVLTNSVVREALVLHLLDDSPCVSAGSCVTVESIDKIPTGSCVAVGKMGI